MSFSLSELAKTFKTVVIEANQDLAIRHSAPAPVVTSGSPFLGNHVKVHIRALGTLLLSEPKIPHAVFSLKEIIRNVGEDLCTRSSQ